MTKEQAKEAKYMEEERKAKVEALKEERKMRDEEKIAK